MKFVNLAAAMAVAVAGVPAIAVDTPAPSVGVAPAIPAPPVATALTLPANTELTLTPNSDVSSKAMKAGDVFAVSTVYDVTMNGMIIIPKGTRGEGKITWRTGKGAFGKSAKMDVAFDWLEVGGRRVVLDGKYRQEGQGNTAATIGAVLAVGVLGGFVTGKSAVIPNGMQLKAFTAEPIQFAAAGLQPVPQQAMIIAGGLAVAQGTSPSIAPVSSPDHAQ